MPIQGFVRLRKHQFARQLAFGTAIAATRAYPFGGTPDVNLNWTDPDGDFGSLAPIAAPYLAAPDIAAALTDSALAYNNLPLLLAAIFGGAVTPTGGGTAQTWSFTPTWQTPDLLDAFTYEFGDDVTTDWFQLRDGILTGLTITGPETMGVLTTSMTWKFGHAASSGSTDFPDSPTVPTAGLSVDRNATMVYLKDAKLFIDNDSSDIGGNQISDALHSFTMTITRTVDEKRFANGTQSFDLQAYGAGGWTIELACQFAKTADTVGIGSEADAWMSETSVDRFVRFEFISKVLAQSPSTFYTWTFDIPLRYYTRADGEINGNTTVTLTGHAFVEADTLDYFFNSDIVNTLTEADLGSVES